VTSCSLVEGVQCFRGNVPSVFVVEEGWRKTFLLWRYG